MIVYIKRDSAATIWAFMDRFDKALSDELNGLKVHRLENVMTLTHAFLFLFDQLKIWFAATVHLTSHSIRWSSYANTILIRKKRTNTSLKQQTLTTYGATPNMSLSRRVIWSYCLFQTHRTLLCMLHVPRSLIYQEQLSVSTSSTEIWRTRLLLTRTVLLPTRWNTPFLNCRPLDTKSLFEHCHIALFLYHPICILVTYMLHGLNKIWILIECNIWCYVTLNIWTQPRPTQHSILDYILP